MKKLLNHKNIKHLAKLSNLVISDSQAQHLTEQLDETLETVSQLDSLDISQVTATSQVTGLTNIFRPDVVDSLRQFTQQQALSGAKQQFQGYFVVKAVINQ